MRCPLVSIVIPTYNYGSYVVQAVESALHQTYHNIEVIVVDDGSKDDTKQRLTPFLSKIRYHYQANAGLSSARNTGMRLAVGEFIALLDSDDAFHPEKIRFQVDCLQKDESLGLIGTQSFSTEDMQWGGYDFECMPISQISLRSVLMSSRFAPSSVMFRRSCIAKVGDFDTGLMSAEDRDYWIRVAREYKMACIDWPLTWYRVTAGSMSKNAEKMERYETEVIKKAFMTPMLEKDLALYNKCLGKAMFVSAWRFKENHRYKMALNRLLRSIALWPFPFRREDGVIWMGRLRLLMHIVRKSMSAR